MSHSVKTPVTEIVAKAESLARLCEQTDVASGVEQLLQGVNEHLGLGDGSGFSHRLSRGGWHRIGGVVDNHYQPVSSNLRHWVEIEHHSDLDQLMLDYLDAGYFVTRITGKTHYFTLPSGSDPDAFMQLEVEALQEVLERPLIDRDWYPDSLEEFIDPLDYPKLEPEVVAAPRYQLRRLFAAADILGRLAKDSRRQQNLQRFLADWQRSSAADDHHFSQHWLLSLQAFTDSEGSQRYNVRPLAASVDNPPQLPDDNNLLNGRELANAIHQYDRAFAYPFAWFFQMLSHKGENYHLANAVLQDQLGAYDYLPVKDLKILRDWEAQPYSV
ncbi:MAG: hypothetical protein HQL49_06985 [Gammaproteobacteria bacterium]|nr:hypothetical protein [Gammaproteobacteria bacterium]